MAMSKSSTLHIQDDTHKHNGVFGERTDLYFAILSGVFLIVGFSIQNLLDVSPFISVISFGLSYFFGAYFSMIEAFQKTIKGYFEIDFLMILAAAGAAYIGSWAEGALLLFLFSMGHAMENYAMNKAKKSIRALGELSPNVALIKRKGQLLEIAIGDLKINDIIVVKPNAKIAADGVIVKGSSSVNQAPITGESMPVDKTAIPESEFPAEFENIHTSHVVYTGTINGDSILEVNVLKLSHDSTISRLINMVSEVETHKSPTQRSTKKFEKWYVPIVLILVIILCFAHVIIDETFQQSLYRAICVLVAASPCALAISTPSAVLSGVARAANKGVLIKGGRALEDMGALKTIAFDKTGTLTEGRPKLTNTIPLNDFGLNDFLKLTYAVESLSNHPLARAISRDIEIRYGVETTIQASDIEAMQGKGIKANYRNKTVYIGNVQLMKDRNITIDKDVISKMEDLQIQGHTVMLVAYNDEVAGLLSVMDLPRATAANTLVRLRKLGIEKMIMLTGDHQNVADAIARQIGLTEARGNLLPEDKVKAILDLKANNAKIAMVGDGVNDAPAMASSTVGIAMGAAGSDVALETADVALMSDRIERLPFVIGLSRASRTIIKENIWISLGVVALLVPATIFGIANIGAAVVFHEGSTVVVVLNALRLLRYNDEDQPDLVN
jgi:Cd2+/Zn2+-exporting ATPase